MSCADPEGGPGGGTGVRPLPEKSQHTIPYCSGSPDKISKLPSQHLMLGHHRHAS